MKLLHICSYYIGNRLYKNMVKELAKKGLKQEVFVPVRKKELQGVNALDQNRYPSVNYYFPHMIKKHHRYFYFQKIRKQQRVLEEQVLKKESVDLIHAHTIFSDGGTAYRIHKKHDIPYVVSVRGTDINRFYKKALHLRPFMYKILQEAKAVVFISHAYQNYLLSMLPPKVAEGLKEKALVIPNGIEGHWLEEGPPEASLEEENGEKELHHPTWLFIGVLNENKNVGSILKALAAFTLRGENMNLKIIGSGPLEEDLKKQVKSLNLEDRVTFYGYVTDPEKIRRIMATSDLFIMASYRETFGLVYVEALSQGLPILYSKDRGFDGFYHEGEVGYSVDPEDPKTIEAGVEKILDNYHRLRRNGKEQAKDFNWQTIAQKMMEIFES